VAKDVKLGVVPEDPLTVVPNLLGFLYRHDCSFLFEGRVQAIPTCRIRLAVATVNECPTTE
jgi:hypothetical protein